MVVLGMIATAAGKSTEGCAFFDTLPLKKGIHISICYFTVSTLIVFVFPGVPLISPPVSTTLSLG